MVGWLVGWSALDYANCLVVCIVIIVLTFAGVAKLAAAVAKLLHFSLVVASSGQHKVSFAEIAAVSGRRPLVMFSRKLHCDSNLRPTTTMS